MTDWTPSPANLPLAAGEIHVWRCSLAPPEDCRLALIQCLSEDERQRGDRFHFEHHRRQWTTARGFLRTVLGRYLDRPAGEVRFRFQDLGKPVLAAEQNPGDIHFNLSHSAEGALLGIARGIPLGVDLEQIRPMENMLSLANRFFAPREAQELAEVSAADRDLAFFNCWTRKEAILKAFGKGLSMPLDRFVVSFRPGESARVLQVIAQAGEADRWQLHALSVWHDYVGCVAYRGNVSPLTCFSFS